MPEPSFDGQAVLVTGGAGFIGSHLVQALLARGALVRVLDDFSTGRRENLEELRGEAEVLEGDLRDAPTCAAACDGVELVFHQAALGSVPRSLEDPATTFGVNVQGSVNLLTAARAAGVRRVVYASSSSVYGDSQELPKREGHEGDPLSPYAASKRMTEETAAIYHRCYDLETVGLRYFNVYGPRQDPQGPYAAVVPRFFIACLKGEPPIIYGDGEQSRDFTWVGDAVAANLLAATAPTGACGRAYNVAFGKEVSIAALAEAVRRLCGSACEPVHEAPRPGDVRHSLADLDLIRNALGYRPETALRTGLARCLEHYRSRQQTLPRAAAHGDDGP